MKSKQILLQQLKEEMGKDTTLPLKSTATNLVFGDGNSQTEIMFIGEGPGYWEDMKGIPFVGNAGAFLNQLLSLAGYSRQEVFITNVIHYRPPENRDPMPEEIEAFQPYLDKIINIIEPKYIITLGRFSMAKFLPGAKISSVHGKAKETIWNDKKLIVVPMYHPAAGLRNPEVKQALINDFKSLGQGLTKFENMTDEEEVGVESKQMNLI